MITRCKIHVAGMRKREIRSAHKKLVRKPERMKEATKWSRLRWEDNIKMEFEDKYGKIGLYLTGPGRGPISGSCESVSKFPSSLKGEEFIEQSGLLGYHHYTLRNNSEERSSQLLRGGSLKSRRIYCSISICGPYRGLCYTVSANSYYSETWDNPKGGISVNINTEY